jgi:hypothetical protein
MAVMVREKGVRAARRSGARRSLILGVLPFVGALLAVVVLANQLVGAARLPEYGTWTGLRPLEAKLRQLTRFAADGPVDAVVLGSSIADTGFSAERFSELMSAELARPYRVFNFSTGGAEVASLPNLYRLMRTAASPRTVMIVMPAGIRRGEGLLPHMPDSALEQAPVRRSLRNQPMLQLEKHLWDLPIVRFASPLRDRLLYGSYRSFEVGIIDVYHVSAWGDRLLYGFESPLADVIRLRGLFAEQLAEPVDDGGNLERYFNGTDISALRELRALATADSVELVIIAHAPAAILSEAPVQDPGYRRRQAAFFQTMAAALDAPLVYALDDFWVPRYATGDTNHINMYGAQVFTEWVTRALLGREPAAGSLDATLARRDWPSPDLTRIRSDDRSLNPFAGIVLRERPELGSTLTVEIVQDYTRNRIPPDPIFLSLRLPNNVDLVAPAVRTSNDVVRASFPNLPAEPQQVLVARIVRKDGDAFVAASTPMAQYGWSTP